MVASTTHNSGLWVVASTATYGCWKTFQYSEPFSRFSRGKHWVDDVNNRRHDPIGLEEVWQTKWWPMQQFTFICSIAEVNAVQSWARGTHEATMPQLQFCRI
jgi:hypothetical protein